MFIQLTKDFIRDPILEMKITEPTDDIVLFGKHYRMYSDEWKHHIHLKCTNLCDAKCKFCIEHDSKQDSENPQKFLENARSLISQMKQNGHFRTLSVTGGEPTLFPYLQNIVDMANEFHPTLFSINSNGRRMNEAIEENTFSGWFDLSKHSTDDRNIFCRDMSIERDDILKFKNRQPNGHVRIQCVLGLDNGLQTIDDVFQFIDHYKDVADNFSFRSLIVETDHDKIPSLFRNLRNKLFDEKCIVEQSIQDYYVYEVYERNGVNITLSWSNMLMLKQYNEQHQDLNFLEEIIVHPDGMITGSWNKKTLIIKQ